MPSKQTTRCCSIIVIFILIISVCSEDCLRYTFEEDFGTLFSNESGLCGGMQFWELRSYSSISMDRPHEYSHLFISPRESLSCVSSFNFNMLAGGTVEVNIYMDGASRNDQISLLVQHNSTGAVAGNTANSALDPNFVRGWHTLRVSLTGNGIFTGYVSVLKRF